MRFIRLLGVVIIFYGLSYLLHGLTQFYWVVQSRALRHVSWYVIATNFNIGAVTFVIGIGILLAKEWARTLWLMSSIALLAVHIFYMWLFSGTAGATQQAINLFLIIMLALLSWTKLTKPEVRELFN